MKKEREIKERLEEEADGLGINDLKENQLEYSNNLGWFKALKWVLEK